MERINRLGTEVQAAAQLSSLARAGVDLVQQAVCSQAKTISITCNAMDLCLQVHDDGRYSFGGDEMNSLGAPGGMGCKRSQWADTRLQTLEQIAKISEVTVVSR